MFLSNTLEDVASEFNRYNSTPRIVVEGEALQRRYSGVFDSNDPQSLIAFLREDPDLTFETHGDDFCVRPRERQ